MSKLTKCKTCKKDIAKTAKTCPHCGANNKKSIGCFTTIIIIILAVIVFNSLHKAKMTPAEKKRGKHIEAVEQKVKKQHEEQYKINKSHVPVKKHFTAVLNKGWKLVGDVYQIRSKSHNKAWYFGAKVKNTSTQQEKCCVWSKSGFPADPGLTFSVNKEAFQASGLGMLNNTKAAVPGGDRESTAILQFLKENHK